MELNSQSTHTNGENKTVGSLNELAVAINKTAHDKGWYDRGIRNFGEVVALMHEGQPILQIKCVSIQELSEALEAWRDDIGEVVCTFKPDGIAVELIDCMIRILDALVEMKIDPEEVLRLKMDYNNTRPYRHGGKLA